MFDRRLLKNFDWQLLLIMLVICAYGLLIIGSATQEANSVDFNVFVKKQLVWIAMGLAAILLVISVDYVNLYNWCWYIYAGNLVFLIAVLFVGREAGGAYRWIDLEIFDFQPSELAKIVIIIALARLLTDYGDKLKDFFTSCIFLFYVAVPILLIALQPDLGTSLVFIIIFFAMLYMSGVPWKNLAIFLGAGLAVFPLLWTRLLPYQKMRLIVFLNPELDPLNFGYQLKQSMIAVGSGGVTGKGLFEGTQARLQFLPAQHTDFIFSVLGEELGFLGAAVLFILYFILIYRILKIASFSKDRFGAYVCFGVAAMVIFQVLVNVGMTLSIMPVTGLPLPFMSYGGNSLLMSMLSIGIVINIGMRRHKIQF